MKLYSDIGKVAKKLLTDDYVFTKKVKVASKTDDGFSYTITGAQGAKDESIDAEANAKLKVQGVAITGKLHTTSKEPTVEAKYETKDAQGRKYLVCGTAGRNLGTTYVEYTGGPLGLKIAADLLKSQMAASAALALTNNDYSGFAVVGAEAEYDLVDKQVSKLNYAISFFDGKESECTLHVLDQAKKGMISYSHHVRPGLSVGAQMIYDRASQATSLALGTAYRLDGVTTVKAKLDSQGSLALSYIQDIRSNTKLIMSTKFNTSTFDSAKVGFSLTVE